MSVGRPPARSGRRSLILTAARVLAVGVLAAFLVIVVARQWNAIRGQLGLFSPLIQLAGLLSVLAGLMCSMQSWRTVLADLGHPLPLRDCARVFFIGQLGKYVPGSLWPIVAQMELGREHDIPRQTMGAVTVVAIVLGVAGSLTVAFATAPLLLPRLEGSAPLVLLALPLLLVVLHPRVLTPLLNRTLRLARREPLAIAPSLRGMVVGLVWACLAWVLLGLQTWIVIVDLTGQTRPALLALALGAFTAAWAVGFFVVLAPAGAGVREAVFVLVLGATIPSATATVVALSSRAALTLGDLLLGACAAGTTQRRSSRRREQRKRERTPIPDDHDKNFVAPPS